MESVGRPAFVLPLLHIASAASRRGDSTTRAENEGRRNHVAGSSSLAKSEAV